LNVSAVKVIASVPELLSVVESLGVLDILSLVQGGEGHSVMATQRWPVEGILLGGTCLTSRL